MKKIFSTFSSLQEESSAIFRQQHQCSDKACRTRSDKLCRNGQLPLVVRRALSDQVRQALSERATPIGCPTSFVGTDYSHWLSDELCRNGIFYIILRPEVAQPGLAGGVPPVMVNATNTKFTTEMVKIAPFSHKHRHLHSHREEEGTVLRRLDLGRLYSHHLHQHLLQAISHN